MSDDAPAPAPEWPAPGDEAYGTMHETFDRHWVECAEEIERYSPFFPWWRMVKTYVLEEIEAADENRPEDEDWKSYIAEVRLQYIRGARKRIPNPTEHAIKLDALSYYKDAEHLWPRFPNW